MSFTNPLRNLGTFFTTIFMLLHSFVPKYQHASHAKPIATTAIPIKNNQPVVGSNITNNTPNPNPIKHTANVFFSSLNIIYYLRFFIILY